MSAMYKLSARCYEILHTGSLKQLVLTINHVRFYSLPVDPSVHCHTAFTGCINVSCSERLGRSVNTISQHFSSVVVIMSRSVTLVWLLLAVLNVHPGNQRMWSLPLRGSARVTLLLLPVVTRTEVRAATSQNSWESHQGGLLQSPWQ